MYAGGLVGKNDSGGWVGNCYAAGIVSAGTYNGGLVGLNETNAAVSYGFYDKDVSGKTDTGKGIGRTTSQMIQISTYTDYGWNFTAGTGIWTIGTSPASYPYFQWQDDTTIPYPTYGFAGGSGTEASPYQVATAAQLNKVRDHLDKHFVQTADINLGVAPWNEGDGWEPIGNNISPFSGRYNGDGYTISSLTINRPTQDYIGLFGMASGTLSKIVLTSADVEGRNHTGSLLGMVNGGSVLRCSSSGTVTGNQYVGGLVGSSPGNYLQVSQSSSAAEVHGNWGLGGLVGMMYGYISDSYATGSVTGNPGSIRVGGLIGEPYGTVTNCYSSGRVSGATSDFGGLLGYQMYAPESSYYDSTTSGQTDTTKGTPKTTAEMQEQATYIGWDFVNTWYINSNYPILQWQVPR